MTPAFMGYLGKNMLDAVAVGETFTPPTVESLYEAFRSADAGRGVVCLCGNYPKDLANVAIAMEQVAAEEDRRAPGGCQRRTLPIPIPTCGAG